MTPPLSSLAARAAAQHRPTASTRAPSLSVCRNVGVVLGRGEALVTALAGIELSIHPGERVVLWGRSGSGKSTLLHVIGGLLAPTSGSVDWEEAPLQTLDAGPGGRRKPLGIANVFQSANLLPYFTAFENVAFASRVADGGARRGAASRAGSPPGSPTAAAGPPALTPFDLLRLVGLEDKADALPGELSGGDAQRVAVARALAQRPHLLLCDEPTGHLDSDTGARVLALIEALQRELGFAMVIATHDPNVAARYQRVVELLDGRVIRDEVQS